MKITNGEFIDCLEKAKVKMKAIQEQNNTLIDFVQTRDLINRMSLCIYDIVQDFIKTRDKKKMKDNYGEQVDELALVLLPDIVDLTDEEIRIIANAKWYDVIFGNEQVLLCADYREIGGLCENGIVGCTNDKNGIVEIMRVNEVLKRWDTEYGDGFYHA